MQHSTPPKSLLEVLGTVFDLRQPWSQFSEPTFSQQMIDGISEQINQLESNIETLQDSTKRAIKKNIALEDHYFHISSYYLKDKQAELEKSSKILGIIKALVQKIASPDEFLQALKSQEEILSKVIAKYKIETSFDLDTAEENQNKLNQLAELQRYFQQQIAEYPREKAPLTGLMNHANRKILCLRALQVIEFLLRALVVTALKFAIYSLGVVLLWPPAVLIASGIALRAIFKMVAQLLLAILSFLRGIMNTIFDTINSFATGKLDFSKTKNDFIESLEHSKAIFSTLYSEGAFFLKSYETSNNPLEFLNKYFQDFMGAAEKQLDSETKNKELGDGSDPLENKEETGTDDDNDSLGADL